MKQKMVYTTTRVMKMALNSIKVKKGAKNELD